MRLRGHRRSPLSETGKLNPSITIPKRCRAAALSVASLVLALAAAIPSHVLAEGSEITPTPKAETSGDLAEITVNGVPYEETVLPTRLKSNSVYGLDLNVMDTPRNTTLLSTTQLQTLDIQDPRAFSYLTASSYTDSSYGAPNIPSIRGQPADVFINGMRSSFTEGGYGAPLNFDSIENISIIKGPASVIDGPGPGVGGQADFATKRPSLSKFQSSASVSVDSVRDRRWTLDVGGPIIPEELGARISYSGDYSDSYFYGHYFHRDAVYAAVRWTPNDNYSLDFNTEVNAEQYTENAGINRVNQDLIDTAQYLQGAPVGAAIYGFMTPVDLTNYVPFNTKVTIDQTPGTSARALKYNAQLIQTYRFSDSSSLQNNTFFDFLNSDNQALYYYADSTKDSFTIENRTTLTHYFALPLGFGTGVATFDNQIATGVSFRYAHVNYISDDSSEPPLAYDLTGNPAQWVFPAAQQAVDDSYPYESANGRMQYGTPGRDLVNNGNSGVSDLHDLALFFQHRMEFTPQFSILYGARIDAVKNHTHDPFGDAQCNYCSGAPQIHTSGIYGLRNGNFSMVYKFRPWVSGYLTFDSTQSLNPNGGNGGINSYSTSTDSVLLRQDSYLYEAGLKLNLLDNKLFAGLAGFDQKRAVPTGAAGTVTDHANIGGAEIELNYQPNRNLFATASYSYIKTTLSQPAAFYNYPAEPGLNYDGAGLLAVFKSGQVFDDPGLPAQIFNFLGNYKFDDGLGLRFGVQVTSPIETTTSGWLDLAASSSVPASIVAKGGYYQSPVIPWQYTMNVAVFYQSRNYTVTVSAYNLTDRLNWQSSPSFYGNDFLVRNNPRTLELRIQANL